MSACKSLDSCLFFNEKLKRMPAMAELYKKQFCRDKYEMCARYIVAETLGRDKVPDDLYPNQKVKAEKFIEERKN